ncbi:copper transporter, putative [Plasmodium knowlesi strain H]|uniref:Copper transport protein n=3 Tax=Plasmodium knowlesi TaxID=5850 RepID=A0A5K1VRL2_PLAKH|nr:copper transporter, putative [Plasmodium knowlesi strain H]OTN65514.1 putative Copper transporter [Plasmodium knowlesi]CAA9989760.1 copper transporter, putative [Plasmodium knowlesi strain H]SBO22928.1 copper transporter, putative [Plasmodium knowlesi strain H]SBO22972.1 copper transporter, putative [Plasmodium knowlesi strain H]VVS79234.1 copper transporter, putative [Plasmodium knowlesi strain H]|eukprot:XP_002260483.1 copper transporter putative [Plasmodium knowlesi strain H]
MNRNIWSVLLIIVVINFLLITGRTTDQRNNGKNGPANNEKKEHSCCSKKDSTENLEGKKKDDDISGDGETLEDNNISKDDRNSKNNGECTPSLHVECAHNCSKKKLAFIYDCWDNFKLYRNIIEQYMRGQGENNFQLQGTGDENSDHDGAGSINGHNMAMPMPMSFQLSTHTIILFKFWETKTEASYYISLVICLLFGVLSVLLKVVRLQVEQTLPKTKDTNIMRSGILFKNNLTRSALSFIIYSWDYLLMLIVMTFNVGLFVAVVVGLSIGFFLFGHKFVTCGSNSTDGLDVHKEFHGDPACCGC